MHPFVSCLRRLSVAPQAPGERGQQQPDSEGYIDPGKGRRFEPAFESRCQALGRAAEIHHGGKGGERRRIQ